MFKEIKVYSVICDNCGTDFMFEEGSCFVEKKDAISHAEAELNYLIIDGKHYCEDCWHYDDNDHIIVNKERACSTTVSPSPNK